MISFAEVDRLLRYDAATGLFFWRVDRTAGVRAGDQTGTKHWSGYIHLHILSRCYTAHRIAWLLTSGSFPEEDIDHINGDRSDNRLCNLRTATPRQNGQNTRLSSINTTGFKGVVRHRGKFRANIRNEEGKRLHLGYFGTAEEAYAAYCEAAREHHGEFARVA